MYVTCRQNHSEIEKRQAEQDEQPHYGAMILMCSATYLYLPICMHIYVCM